MRKEYNMINDEIKISKEPLPVEVQEFMDRVPKSEHHGVYHIETVDIDGNKTGEAFALNLMTNYGVNKQFASNNTLYYNIYIGTSTELPTLENNTIRTPFVTNSANGNDTSLVSYPSKYNKETHILTQRYKRAYGYFDYNYSGITEDVEITEIGLGEAYNRLYYHSYVCDANGNPSSITKRPNERLYITAYTGACVNVDLMKQKWDEGIYLFVNAYAFSFGYGSYDLYLSVGRRDRDDYDRYYPSKSYGLSGNNINTDTHVLEFGNMTLDVGVLDKTDHMYYSVSIIGTSSRLYDTNYYADRMNFFAFTFEEMDKETTPIEDRTLTTIDAYTNSYKSNSFSYLFGRKSYKDYSKTRYEYFSYSNGELPCVNFDIQSLKMYNHLTKEWDIEESYVNNPDMDYNYIWAYTSGKCYIENFSHNGGMTIYVFINPHTEWELYAFNTSGVTLYGTDEWWDVDTYIKIPDISNLPSNARNCRYYIMTSGDVHNIYPSYNITGREDALFNNQHMINPMNELIIPSNVVSNTTGTQRPVSSDVNNWFCTSNQLVYAPTEVDTEWHVYAIKAYGDSSASAYDSGYGSGGPAVFRYNTDDRLCLGTSLKTYYAGTGWRIYNTSDRSVEPTYVDILLPSNDDSSEYTKRAFISFTSNGFIVRQSLVKSSSEIINIYGYQDEEGNTIYTETLQNTNMCFALNLTDNCVYRKTDADVPGTFEIYDMRNKTVIDSFTLPTENTYTYNNIFGWREFIYVLATITSSNVKKIYFYNYNDPTRGVIELNAPTDIPDISKYDSYNRTDTSVSECYIISNSNENSNETKLISADDPTSFKKISHDPQYDYRNHANQLCQLKYINDGKQLIYCAPFSNSNNYLTIFDIGYVLDNGSDDYVIPYKNFPMLLRRYGNYTYSSGFACIFRNGIIISSAFNNNSGGKTNDVVKWYPIERFLHHRMSGTTTTLNTFNNPIKLTGKTWNFSVSNHMDTILGVSNTTETPIDET